MRNCLTYALQIEGQKGVDYYTFLDLAYTKNTVNELKEIAKKFRRSLRQLESTEESLIDGEWIMVLYGPIVTKRDYEGIPAEYDVHAIKVNNDGIWTHRRHIEADITEVPQSTLKAFASEGYEPQYFAVKRIGV